MKLHTISLHLHINHAAMTSLLETCSPFSCGVSTQLSGSLLCPLHEGKRRDLEFQQPALLKFADLGNTAIINNAETLPMF